MNTRVMMYSVLSSLIFFSHSAMSVKTQLDPLQDEKVLWFHIAESEGTNLFIDSKNYSRHGQYAVYIIKVIFPDGEMKLDSNIVKAAITIVKADCSNKNVIYLKSLFFNEKYKYFYTDNESFSTDVKPKTLAWVHFNVACSRKSYTS